MDEPIIDLNSDAYFMGEALRQARKAFKADEVPVGAVITKPKIMDRVFNSMERCVVHSNTFGQNDLAMAAALARLIEPSRHTP